jgi:hypothetical protein
MKFCLGVAMGAGREPCANHRSRRARGCTTINDAGCGVLAFRTNAIFCQSCEPERGYGTALHLILIAYSTFNYRPDIDASKYQTFRTFL